MGQLRNPCVCFRQSLFFFTKCFSGVCPFHVKHSGFCPTNVPGQVPIPRCLPRLALKACQLRFNLHHHIIKTGEICLCSFEPQLRLMTTCMEAGNASGFFQNSATVHGFRRNQLSNLSLANQCRGVGAGGGVCK